MSNKKLEEKKNQRARLDSMPIISGMAIDDSRDVDKKRGREEEKREEGSEKDTSKPEDKSSPEAKKLRNDVQVIQTIDLSVQEPRLTKMEIVPEMKNAMEEVVVDTKIISKLIENIDEEKVKTLIECFNPAIRNNPEYIKEQMIECSIDWENRTDVFKGAISYIVHNSQIGRYNVEKIKDLGTDILSAILTREIENRMPTFCEKCEKWYIVGFGDHPAMHCMWCRVGIHDCEDLSISSKYPGMKWLCKICEPKFTEHFLPKLDPFSLFDGFTSKKKSNKLSNKYNDPETKNNKEETEKAEHIEVVVTINDNEVENDIGENTNAIGRNANDDDRKTNKDRNINSDDSNDDSDQINSVNNNKDNKVQERPKEICWYWKNRKCRYTTRCNKDHPEQCKEMLEKGLCKDSRCKLFHPKICRNLFYKQYCPRGESCWFIHPSEIENNPNMQNLTNTFNNTISGANQNQNINNFSNNGVNQNINNMGQNYQNQNMKNQNNFTDRSGNRSFLGTYHQPINNWSQAVSQNQTMNQMMQNIMEKMTTIENKMTHMEMERRMFNHR